MLVKVTKSDLLDFFTENLNSHASSEELADLLLKKFESQGNPKVWCVTSKSTDSEIVGVFSEVESASKIKAALPKAGMAWRTVDSLKSKGEQGAKLFELQIMRDGTVDFIRQTNQYKLPIAGISNQGKFRIFGSFWGHDESDAIGEAVRFMEKNDFPVEFNTQTFDPSVGAIFYSLKYIE